MEHNHERAPERPSDADQPDVNRFPNRKQRRMIAKRRGVFGHAGLWPKVNGGYTNKQTRRNDQNGEG